MDETSLSKARIEVFWRPGCSYCARLRRGLAKAGIDTVERDIWSDPAAAARVRAATGGDETVPTVVVGARALVNPSVAQVVTAVRAEFPQDAEALVGGVSTTGPRSLGSSAGWSAVVALAWVLLALWQPTTTWHLVPTLLAGVWPWMTGQDLRAGDRLAAARLGGAGVAGFVVSALATLGLSRAELLRGPTILGFSSATTEALVLAGATAVTVVLVNLLRMLRTPDGPVGG
ncbi:MAG: glutaredoxin family protein [Pseudonocardia sp.]